MTISDFIFKVNLKLKNIAIYCIFQYPRVLKYKFLSDNKNIIGNPTYNQPTQLLGKGTIMFGKNVNLGVKPSPNLYSGYGYIDARKPYSKIFIGDGVWINNNFMIASEGKGIEIGARTLIGLNVEISDSDFHDLHPDKRMSGVPKTSKVVISENVFIGSNVKILKGVTIGKNSLIANSSVVTKSIPENVIAGGNPCKVIRQIDFN
jgi:acetyltransferase-like isoleucine patch superfamily enzyme